MRVPTLEELGIGAPIVKVIKYFGATSYRMAVSSSSVISTEERAQFVITVIIIAQLLCLLERRLRFFSVDLI